jgi:hypothetical protein
MNYLAPADTSNAKRSTRTTQIAKGEPSRIPRDDAFQLSRDLFNKLAEQNLAGTHYLAFGSVAKELLNPQGAPDFGDLDILTIRPLATAIDDITWALGSLGIPYENLGDGNLIVTYGNKRIQVQIVDTEYGKNAYPGGFIGFKDSEFDAGRCVQYPGGGACNTVPCVSAAFLDTQHKSFYFKGDPKMDPDAGKSGDKVSPFSF